MKLSGTRDGTTVTVETDNVPEALAVFHALMASINEVSEPVNAVAERQLGFNIPEDDE